MTPRALILTLAAGAILGVLSRLTDTAAWAPSWIGYVFSPWLAAAWLTGVTAATPRAGAWHGLALLLTTLAVYLALAGTDAATWAPRLIPIALVAGPVFGAAGAAWRRRGRFARAAGALLGASVAIEGLLLQLVAQSATERVLLAGESLLGLVLIGVASWARGERVTGGLVQRTVTGPVMSLLRQGITPEKMALCLALGAGIGLFPILGTTTLICAVVALTLRLNLIAIQFANYVVYPLQLLMIIPFLRLGEWLAGAPPFPLSVTEIVDRFHAGVWNGVSTLATALVHAILGWVVVVPAMVVLLWFALRPMLRRMASALAAHRAAKSS